MSQQLPSRDHYDAYYAGSSRWREVSARDKLNNVEKLWNRTLAERLPRVIDIGCGEGALAAGLLDAGFASEIVGVDVSQSGIAAADARKLTAARFEQFDGSTLQYDDDAFDLAVMSHVVEHLDHPRQVLNEAARVAAYLFVEVPLEHRYLRRKRDFTWTSVGHINFYDRRLIRFLLQSCGLEILDEAITNPSRDVLAVGRSSIRGVAQWSAREVALRLSPTAASSIFTYHNSLLARRVKRRSTVMDM